MHTHAVVLIDENKAMCWNSVQNNRACIGRTMLAIEALVQFEQIAQMAKKSWHAASHSFCQRLSGANKCAYIWLLLLLPRPPLHLHFQFIWQHSFEIFYTCTSSYLYKDTDDEKGPHPPLWRLKRGLCMRRIKMLFFNRHQEDAPSSRAKAKAVLECVNEHTRARCACEPAITNGTPLPGRLLKGCLFVWINQKQIQIKKIEVCHVYHP